MAHLKKRMKEKNNLSYGALVGLIIIVLGQKSAPSNVHSCLVLSLPIASSFDHYS